MSEPHRSSRSSLSNFLFSCVSPQTVEGEDFYTDQGSYYWSKPLLEGFLLKKGQGINLGLKRRWFVLSEGRMYYYKTSDAIRGTELGYIDLSNFKLEFDPSVPCHFRINTPQRIWYLTAEAEEECRFWVEGIRSFQQRLLRRESVRKSRTDSFLALEEDPEDLKILLTEAELEIEANKTHVDELYKDLQNSIQIIKLKNEQIDILTARLDEQGVSATPERSTPQIIPDTDPLPHIPQEQHSWRPSSYDERVFAKKPRTKNIEIRSFNQANEMHNKNEEPTTEANAGKEENEEKTGIDEVPREDSQDIFEYLEKQMSSFLEYLADDEHSKSSRIAISVWLGAIEKHKREREETESVNK
mmetsp:Transcript_5748/g.7101  ORF Transcript_5748/g.7101 Transcript_5748/m.7101 type:complete len:357 (-) Transcript_5748:18-1088(-)